MLKLIESREDYNSHTDLKERWSQVDQRLARRFESRRIRVKEIWRIENAELFCAEEATKFCTDFITILRATVQYAQAVNPEYIELKGSSEDFMKYAMSELSRLDPAVLINLMRKHADPQHTGVTFEYSVQLMYWLLSKANDDSFINKEHFSCCCILGCKTLGCTCPEQISPINDNPIAFLEKLQEISLAHLERVESCDKDCDHCSHHDDLVNITDELTKLQEIRDQRDLEKEQYHNEMPSSTSPTIHGSIEPNQWWNQKTGHDA